MFILVQNFPSKNYSDKLHIPCSMHKSRADMFITEKHVKPNQREKTHMILISCKVWTHCNSMNDCKHHLTPWLLKVCTNINEWEIHLLSYTKGLFLSQIWSGTRFWRLHWLDITAKLTRALPWDHFCFLISIRLKITNTKSLIDSIYSLR